MGRSRSLWLLALALPLACSSTKKEPLPAPDDFVAQIKENPSCALLCDATCAEAETTWKCAALAPWGDIPHDPACGAFDGTTYPAVVPGACVASDPSGDALAKATATGTPIVLPDGRRLAPAGSEWVFSEPDLGGGFPASLLLIPGGKWLAVIDDGYLTHALRIVDAAALRGGGASPVTGLATFPSPHALNYGLAFRDATKTLYAAAGSPDSRIYAFDVDVVSGKLTANKGKTIALPQDAIAQGIAISPDGKTLLVGQAKDAKLLVFSVDDATHGSPLGQIDVPGKDVFAVHFDPNDPAGNTAYATMWTASLDPADTSKMRLLQIDVAAKSVKTIAVGKAPEEIAFIDARYAVVTNALSDSISIVDRPAGAIASTVAVAEKGAGPSAIAYDAPRKRLYVTLSSTNGVAAFDVDTGATPPALTPAGTIPTAWWPTGVAVDPADGTVYVTNGKGHGAGTDSAARTFDDGAVGQRGRGSVQAIAFMDGAALGDASAKHAAQNKVAAIPGYSSVDCKGAAYDFPVPQRIEDGASAKIKNVFFIVRENKTFDDIFGDVPGLDGDPKLVMAPGHMEEIWGNARAIGGAFAHMDNYYEDAEQSIQGHAWTVFGRSTDYTERRWGIIWGRGEFSETSAPGVGNETTPLEGTLFTSLASQNVSVDTMGELIGGLGPFRDTQWPGGSTSAAIPDTLGACYVAARARVLCNAKEFSYVWLNNDHAFGLAAGKPNPALMIATNDEGTGMLLDGVSHSPIWEKSLVIVVEDDPNTGGDHVDLHRSIALFASPWVKRKYVSHAHYDIASVHKLIAHLFGKPYRNATIANAPLPLDLFTSTPDYTPYVYKPRGYKDLACNPAGTTGAKAAEGWDFSEPDEQPGVDAQNWDALRHLAPVTDPARR